MYDGTIVVLYAKPGLNGDAYFTRKANYGLNLQVFFFISKKERFTPSITDRELGIKSSHC